MTFNIGGMPPAALVTMAEGMLVGEGYTWTAPDPGSNSQFVMRDGEMVCRVTFHPPKDAGTLPALVVEPQTATAFDMMAGIFVAVSTIVASGAGKPVTPT
jgi:hypothetical protein